MTDLRPYVPGQTGTLGDVVEHIPTISQPPIAGPDDYKPAPSLGDMFSAARPIALHDTVGPAYEDASTYQGYAPIMQALGLPDSENPGYFANVDPAGEARFGDGGAPSMLATQSQVGAQVPFARNRLADRALQESLVVDRIKALRAKDPNALPGVPDTVEGLHAYFEQQQAVKRAAGADVLSRGGTVGRLAAGLGAGLSVTDPVQLAPQLVMGGTASSLAQAAGHDALINGVLSATQTASNIAEGREHPGSFGTGLEDVLTSGVEGAATGAFLGAAAHGVTHYVAPVLTENLFKAMPESVQTRWAGKMKVGGVPLEDVLHDMDNSELSSFARSAIGPHMTSDETAAADTLERSQELGQASPYMPGPQGDAAHNANLADALKRMVDGVQGGEPLSSGTSIGSGVTVPPLGSLDTSRAAVPHDIVDFFRSKGLDEAHAYGIAAGIVAESGGDHTIVNRQSGAFGLGQWLGDRKAKLVARFGENPTREQQLEYLWGELTGGDPGGKFVMGAKDAGQVLDAYVRKFMRPHAGFETDRDLSAGMAALGKKGALPEASADVGAGGDDAAALDREAADAESEAEQLSADRARADQADAEAEGAQGAENVSAPRELGPDDMPILRRELFGSDADWFDAQLAFYRSQGLHPNGPEEAATAPLSAETDAAGQSQPEAGTAPGASGEAPASAAPTVTYHIVDTHAGDEVVAATDTFGEALAKQRALNADAEARNGVPRYLVGKVEATPATGPLTRAELEALRPADNRRDALWLAGHQIVTSAEQGRKVAPTWGVRDPETGELVTWAMNKRAAESARADQWNPERLQVDKLTPEEITAELRDRLAAPRPPVSVDVRIDEPALKAFDEPGGEGVKASVASLEHDYRMAAADPELAKRAYDLGDGGKPKTIEQILDGIDSDRKAAAALRACAGGGGE